MRRFGLAVLTATTVFLMAATVASSASAGVVAPSTFSVGGWGCYITAGGGTLLPPPNPKTSVLPTNGLTSPSGCPFGTPMLRNNSPLTLRVDDTAGELILESGSLTVTGFLWTNCVISIVAPGVTIPRVAGTRQYQRNIPMGGNITASGSCVSQIDLNLYLT